MDIQNTLLKYFSSNTNLRQKCMLEPFWLFLRFLLYWTVLLQWVVNYLLILLPTMLLNSNDSYFKCVSQIQTKLSFWGLNVLNFTKSAFVVVVKASFSFPQIIPKCTQNHTLYVILYHFYNTS